MNFPNLNKDVFLSETESSIFSDTCIQEFSSINQALYPDSFFTPWKEEAVESPSETFFPNANQDYVALYEENQALRKKIKYLENSLKETAKSTQSNPSLYGQTQSTGWATSRKTSILEENENNLCVRRNLISELDQTSDCQCPRKRSRPHSCTKNPHKFLKTAIINSIKALKF